MRTSAAERVGIFLAVVEACLFGFIATMHAGIQWRIGTAHYAAPFLYPAAIIEAFLAVTLLVSVVVPGSRAGRVLAAQILVLIGVFVMQVALMRGAALTSLGTELIHVVLLVLAITSIVLVASPLIVNVRRRDISPTPRH